MKYFTFLISFVLATACVTYRPATPVPPPAAQWKTFFMPEVNSPSSVTSVLESMGGRVVAAGYAKRGDHWDMVFRFFTRDRGLPLGQPIFSQKPGDDACNGMALTRDGGFLAVGYTTEIPKVGAGHPPSKGKNTWVVRLDESGKKLWDVIPAATTGNDELHAVVALADSTFVAVGTLDERPFLVHIGMEGSILRRDTFDMEKAEALAIGVNDKHELAISGKQGKGFRKKAFMLLLNADFSIKYQKYADKSPQTGSAIEYDHLKKNFVVLTGADEEEQGDLSAFYADSAQGKNSPMGIFAPVDNGTFVEVHATALLPLRTGKFLALGYLKNANDRPFWAELDKGKNTRINEEDKYPLTSVHTASLRHDNMVLWGGLQRDGFEENGWIGCFAPPAPPVKSTDQSFKIDLVESSLRLFDRNKLDTLEGKERAYLSFKVKNLGKHPAFGLKIAVCPVGFHPALGYFDTIPVGTIWPGETCACSVPLFGRPDLENGDVDLRIAVLGEKGTIADQYTYRLKTRETPRPRLQIALQFSYDNLRSDSVLPREIPVTMRVWVRNFGDTTAQNVRFSVNFPYFVEALDQTDTSITQLRRDDSCLFQRRFVIRWPYQKNWLRINCNVFEDLPEYQYSQDYAIDYVRVADYLEARRSDGSFIIPRPIGGRAPLPNPVQPQDPVLRWEFTPNDDPNSDKYQEMKQGLEKCFWQRIRMKALLSGVAAPNKNKLTVTCTRKKQNKTDTLRNVGFALIEAGQFRINIEVPLEQGDNELKLQYDQLPSIGFRIYYTPPNLHFFSIGINGEGMNAPAQNAAAVYRAFLSNNNNLLYKNNIHILYNRDDSTVKREINAFPVTFITDRTVGNLNARGQKRPLILPQDILMGYISAHGIAADKMYAVTRDESGEIYYFPITDLTKTMSDSNCEEILLIVDACASGHLVNQYKIANTRKENSNSIWRADSTQFAPAVYCTR
jgi:hypothetical protein